MEDTKLFTDRKFLLGNTFWGVRGEGEVGNKMRTKEASWKPVTALPLEKMLLNHVVEEGEGRLRICEALEGRVSRQTATKREAPASPPRFLALVMSDQRPAGTSNLQEWLCAGMYLGVRHDL